MNDCDMICGTCKYHQKDMLDEYACANDKSDFFADLTPYKHTCEEYEERQKEVTRKYEW